VAKIEGYADIAKDEFDALEKKLSPDTDKDLEMLKPEIKKLLSQEIVKRYYYQKGAIRENLKNDDGLKKALEVLKDKNEYSKLLLPKKK
jgi:carboxyl-terminal processing protease